MPLPYPQPRPRFALLKVYYAQFARVPITLGSFLRTMAIVVTISTTVGSKGSAFPLLTPSVRYVDTTPIDMNDIYFICITVSRCNISFNPASRPASLRVFFPAEGDHVFIIVNHRNRIFLFRPNTNLRWLEITEYSAETEYSVTDYL